MKKVALSIGIYLFFSLYLSGQPYKFYYANTVKFLKSNNDSLKMPFTGGMNAPQFSNIDFNRDGIMDLFVFDRTGNRPLAFVKDNSGYIHAPQYEGQFPYMTSWCLLRDYNGDGQPDIFTDLSIDKNDLVDTTRATGGYGGIRILKNLTTSPLKLAFKQLTNELMDTGGIWTDLAIPKPRGSIAVNSGDIPAIDDLDNDGDADIISFYGADLATRYYENYMKNKYGIQYSPDSTRYIQRDYCWGYTYYDVGTYRNLFKLNVARELIATCFNQMYEKHGRHTATTMCMLDYNGDGIKDIIYGDGAFKNMILLTNSKNSLGRDSIIAQDTAFPSNTTPAQFIIYPIGYYVDMDGDGVNEFLLTTNEPVAAKSVNNVWVYENTGTTNKPVLSFKGNDFFVYNETIDLGTRSVPVLVDIDGDGDQDLVVGTSGDFEHTGNFNDRLVLFKNIAKVNGRAVFSLADTNFLQLSKDTPLFSIHPAFADLNNDSKPDLLIGDGNGYIMYYINKSSGSNYSFELQTRKLGNLRGGINAAPAFADLDKDGDYDMVIGNRDGILKYYRNNGTPSSPEFNPSADIDSFGQVMVKDITPTFYGPQYAVSGNATPVFYDLDKDNNMELIVGSEGGKVYVYTGVTTIPGIAFPKLENLFVDYSNNTSARSLRFGTFSSPCIGLLDEDDKPDMLIGNSLGGLNFYASRDNNPPVGTGEIKVTHPDKFTLYPNPAASKLYIGYANIDDDGMYHVYNQMGQLVSSGRINHYYTENVVDINNLNAGIYFIRLSGSSYSETHKFIVER